LGECHYQSGNYEAMIVAETCRQFLEDCGVDPERMSLEWASAAEAPRFVELITGYVSKIKDKGPLGQADGEEERQRLVRHLEAGVKAAQARKPRTALGNLSKRLHKEGDFSKEAISEGVKSKILPALRSQRILEEIKMLISAEPMSIEDLCNEARAEKEEVEKHLASLEKKGSVKEQDGKWSLA